jgi:CHAD domain-containing protein
MRELRLRTGHSVGVGVMTGHTEIERKYDVDPDFVLPDLSTDAPETRTLLARYYDTSDLRLAAHGVTLRHRRGGEDDGWHLKLPVDATARRELRDAADEAADEAAVPGRFAELVAAYARGEPLEQVATLETRRTAVRLRGDGGEVLAEIADDRVRGESGGRTRRWREIEVELAAGSPEVLDAVGERLCAAGARPSRAPSKLARLLAIPRPAPPAAPRTAADVIVAYVAEQVATILAYDPRVRLREYDSVHKMRVAVRRIRSLLRSGQRLLNTARTDPLEAELRWLADALGEVRDLEVLRERFAQRLAGIDVAVPAWLVALGERQEAEERRLNRTLSGERYFALLDALEEFVAHPPETSRGTPSDLVAKAWRRMTRRHAEIESHDHPDEARHRTRKAAKRARYTAEAVSPVLGKPARKLAERAKRVQDTLGAYQDSVIARERLAALAADGADPATVDMLTGIEQEAADQALRDADRAWRRAAKSRYLDVG